MSQIYQLVQSKRRLRAEWLTLLHLELLLAAKYLAKTELSHCEIFPILDSISCERFCGNKITWWDRNNNVYTTKQDFKADCQVCRLVGAYLSNCLDGLHRWLGNI